MAIIINAVASILHASICTRLVFINFLLHSQLHLKKCRFLNGFFLPFFFSSLDCEDSSQVLDVEGAEQGMVARDGRQVPSGTPSFELIP